MLDAQDTDVRILLAPSPESPAAARDAMDRFEGWVDDETLENLRLIVSELVTNSYRHATMRGDERVEVRAGLRDGVLRLEVQDPGHGFAAPDDPVPQAESGWGLYLVDHIADRWGVNRGPDTEVWAELDVD
ncbi:MAG TPA: ATP-binding protein [Actinomycetota bacterium]